MLAWHRRLPDRVAKVCAALMITVGCTAGCVGTAQAADKKVINYLSAFPTMSVVLANQTSLPSYLGYYEKEGVTVNFSLAGAAGVSGAVQLVASGQQNVGSGTQSPALASKARGEDLDVVFFYNQLRNFHYALGVNPDSAIKSIADLKGKSIGVPTLASEGIVVARHFAKQAGLDPDKDINFVAIGVGAQAAHALSSKRVDAICTTRSVFAQMALLDQNYRYLEPPPGTGAVFGPGLFARRDYIAANREALIGLGRAVAKSTLFLITNPEAAILIHWKIYPQQMPRGVPKEKALADTLAVLKVQIEGLRPESSGLYGDYPPTSWQHYASVFGFADKITNVSDFYTNDLIAEINNFDHAAVIAEAKNFRLP